MNRAFGPCRHERTEPVELFNTGEVVALVCADCFDRLPADWDGSLTEIRTGDGRVVAYLPA